MAQGEKLNSTLEKECEKSKKAHFLELQVQQAISETLYELGTLNLANSTCYNQYSMILY